MELSHEAGEFFEAEMLWNNLFPKFQLIFDKNMVSITIPGYRILILVILNY